MGAPKKYGRVTEEQLSERIGKSLRTIRRWTDIGGIAKGPDGLYDLELALRYSQSRHAGGRPPKREASTEADAAPQREPDWGLRLKREQARKAALERRELQGRLVLRSRVEAVWAERATQVRDQLLQLGPRLGGRLAAETDPVICSELVTDEVMLALRALADEAM